MTSHPDLMTSSRDFPEAWQRGRQLFNQGEWWEAHEAWEQGWLVATGEHRVALQALILLAAALHKQWRMGSLTGRNFTKAQRYLRQLSPGAFGVDWLVLEQQVAASLRRSESVPLPQIPLLDTVPPKLESEKQ